MHIGELPHGTDCSGSGSKVLKDIHVHRGVCTPNSLPTQCVPEERSPKAACKASSYSVILRLHSQSLVSVQFSFPEDYTMSDTATE